MQGSRFAMPAGISIDPSQTLGLDDLRVRSMWLGYARSRDQCGYAPDITQLGVAAAVLSTSLISSFISPLKSPVGQTVSRADVGASCGRQPRASPAIG
jgi:hypothetical protein